MKTDEKAELDGSGETGDRSGRPEGRDDTGGERRDRHQITQGQFYQWRDRLLAEGSKLFARGGVDKEAERLKEENQRLKQAVGELTMELKKNDW